MFEIENQNRQPQQNDKQLVIDYYDQEAAQYQDYYTKSLLDQEFYPANAIRLDMIVDRLKELGKKSILDVGCGSGQPMIRLLNESFDAVGFDFSPKMTEAAKKALARAGFESSRAVQGDIEVDSLVPPGPFDSIVATGVFPHNFNDQAAYANIKKRLKPDGIAFIEYRNALMSLFSINKYSSSFFWNDLLNGENLPPELKKDVLSFLADKFSTSVESIGGAREIEYSQILAKFHNPLTLADELIGQGLQVVDIHYYHIHAGPPSLEKKHKDAFWTTSLAQERKRDWRNMFRCSAFVAEITHA